MKIIVSILYILILTSCGIQKKTNEVSPKNITINLKKEKTEFTPNVNLYIVITNNSNKDITILKPATKFGNQMDFFSVKYECENSIPYMVSSTPIIKRTEKELITINAKSSLELKLQGFPNHVFCDNDISEITKVKVIYNNTNELSEFLIKKIGSEQNIIKDKLTLLKIESKETSISRSIRQ